MKTIVVTGATSGIGFAVCRALIDHGYGILAVGRTKENCDTARKRIAVEIPDADITYFFGDLAQQREVNRIADEISAYLNSRFDGGLYALINNAGGVRNWYMTTEEGYELQFALNHLAGFLLTYRLMPYLLKAGGRVIMTGSDSHKHAKMHWKDIMYQKRYSCLFAYKQSKLCNMLFAAELNRRYADRGVRAYVVNPGLVCTDIGSKHTNGVVSRFWSMRKRFGAVPDVPARTYEYLCETQPAPEGIYYYLCGGRSYSKYADSEHDAERLFKLSEKLCGIEWEA